MNENCSPGARGVDPLSPSSGLTKAPAMGTRWSAKESKSGVGPSSEMANALPLRTTPSVAAGGGEAAGMRETALADRRAKSLASVPPVELKLPWSQMVAMT